MSDHKLDIDIVTRQTGDGAKKAADEIKNVSSAATEASKKVDDLNKTQKESDSTSKKGANQAKNYGNAIKNFVTGNVDGAISSLQNLGPKIVAIGSVAMAAVASLKAIGDAVKRFAVAAREAKKADIDILTRNAAESAAAAAASYERMADAISRAADSRESMAQLAAEAAELADQTERQNIANNRAQELAGTTDEIERAQINKKYDAQAAAIDSRARARGVSSEAERIEREKQRLQEENANLRQGIKTDRRTIGSLTRAANMAGQEGDDAMPRWATPLVDIGGWDSKKMAIAQSFFDKQTELTGKAGETLQSMRAKADQLKANEQKERDLEQRKKTIIPAMQTLADTTNQGDTVSDASKGIDIRRMQDAKNEREATAARQAAEAAEKEAAAKEAYNYGSRSLSAAQGDAARADEQYRSSPSMETARALQEAKAAVKEQEAAIKELARALTQASRQAARHAKTATADISGD